MYRPLPDGLTIKNSPIEGLGLFATVNIKKNTFIGVTHIRDEQFENKYIRTPLGGFYNHSNEPTVIRMVSDVLPKLKFGDPYVAARNGWLDDVIEGELTRKRIIDSLELLSSKQEWSPSKKHGNIPL